MKKDKKPDRSKKEGVIALEDLVPRKDPKGGSGGSGKAVFGGGPIVPGPEVLDREVKKPRREK